MSAPAFAVLIDDCHPNRLRVAVFSSASDIQYREVDNGFSLGDLKHLLRGLVVIAVDAERIANALVPQGFVAFNPIEYTAFTSLFSLNLQSTRNDDRFVAQSQFVAERIDWLVARGAEFLRQLESWALTGRPELHEMFATAADLSDVDSELGGERRAS